MALINSIFLLGYETLYELYLKQMEQNPTPEYLKQIEIKEDIKRAKKLVKKPKRA